MTSSDETDAIRRMIVAREETWYELIQAQKWTDIRDTIMAPGYTNTDAGGCVWTSDEDLESCASQEYTVTVVSHRTPEVIVHSASCATALGDDVLNSCFEGEPAGGHYVWTDTWVRLGDEWKCAASHGSKIVCPLTGDARAAIEDAIRAQEELWYSLIARRDWTRIGSSILADGYVNKDFKGRSWTKADDLENCSSRAYNVQINMHVPPVITVHNSNHATAKGEDQLEAQFNGDDESGHYFWTDDWRNIGGSWLCVSSRSFRV